MRPSTFTASSPSSPAAPMDGGRTAFAMAALALFAVAGAVLTAHAQDKPAPMATTRPAVTLSPQQLADIAAKGVPNPPGPVAVMPMATTRILRTVGPSTGLERVVPAEVPASPQRLPAISEALGPIPRESWLRKALGKRDDIAVVGGRLVPVVTGGAPR